MELGRVLAELWASLNAWIPPTALGSWLPTSASRSSGKLGPPRRPLEVRMERRGPRCREALQALQGHSPADWHFLPDAPGWQRNNGIAIGSKIVKHVAPGKRLTSQMTLFCYIILFFFFFFFCHSYIDLSSFIFRRDNFLQGRIVPIFRHYNAT